MNSNVIRVSTVPSSISISRSFRLDRRCRGRVHCRTSSTFFPMWGGRKGRGKLAASALRHKLDSRAGYSRQIRDWQEGIRIEDVGFKEPLQQVPRHWWRGGYRGGKGQERVVVMRRRTECRLAASAVVVVPSSNGQIGIYFRRGGGTSHSTRQKTK